MSFGPRVSNKLTPVQIVYLNSIALCMVGCIVAATAKTIDVLIGMRCLQAAGYTCLVQDSRYKLTFFMQLKRGNVYWSSNPGRPLRAFRTWNHDGDILLVCTHQPNELSTSNTKSNSAPLLGPSLGPILGGVLTQGFNWRATFWFLSIFTGLCTLSFIFFRDTFRRERSLTYQTVLKRVLEQEAKKAAAEVTKQATAKKVEDTDNTRSAVAPVDEKSSNDAGSGDGGEDRDVEAQTALAASEIPQAVKEVRLSLKDVNPIRPIVFVLCRPNNVVILFASGMELCTCDMLDAQIPIGLLFAFNFSITYTASRTLANDYHYDALDTGFVLLSYGIGVSRTALSLPTV